MQQETKCQNCNSKNITKVGIRKNKQQQIQRYNCKQCDKTFTAEQIKHKTYPTKIILNAISNYNLGYSQTEVSKLINQRFKTKTPQRTISQWINEYKPITTYNRLRKEAKKLYTAEEIIETYEFLHNNLPYKFQMHRAKLELLFKSRLYNNKFSNIKKFQKPLQEYMEKIPTKQFPHHIFNKNPDKDSEQRASQLKFSYLKINHLSKNNLANKLVFLALNLAKSNKDRHQAIQNFMLINDSTTIATEIPVYLTNDDITYFLSKRFQIKNLINRETPITGHVDLLQIRNGLIHILDYKPEADKEKPIEQLTIYALALASRTKLALSDFKCAWFDENNYYEFFPLHAVYKLKKNKKIDKYLRILKSVER